MKVTFCGHSNYRRREEDKDQLMKILHERVGDELCDFLLGEYGGFDSFTYDCAKLYKSMHPNVRLIFVQPYLSLEHCKRYNLDKFDFTVYPGLEEKPMKYAISYRNRWMIEEADIVIAYINHTYGGAYAAYRYARQKKKEIYQLGKLKQ